MKKPCILVAEDNEGQRELFTLILEMKGFEVRSVTNGKEALTELQQSLPDLILADIAMPVMGGLELVKQVKSQTEFAGVPIVVMTAFEKGYLTWAWAAGANGLLAKPFEPEDLYEAILRVLPESVALEY